MQKGKMKRGSFPKEEQERDTAPINTLLRLMEAFDGLIIYPLR